MYKMYVIVGLLRENKSFFKRTEFTNLRIWIEVYFNYQTKERNCYLRKIQSSEPYLLMYK